MGEWKRLPFGIDLGSTRLRLAFGERNRAGSVRLRAVVTRELPDGAVTPTTVEAPQLVAAVAEEALSEIGTRERRCVLALGAPAAAVRAIRFPKMSWAERMRAARFEARRFCDWNLDEEASLVRSHPFDRANGTFMVGAVRASSVASRVAALRATGLRIVAIDHDALAMQRLFAPCNAVADVGFERSSLHVFGESGPRTLVTSAGGATISRGIAADLAIDLPTAERRKRILGCAGAGAAAREEFVAQLRALVDRARSRTAIDRIVMTGNGARLPNLARDVEAATGAIVEIPVPELLRCGSYPEDVVRAAAPDWSLAAALLTWDLPA